MKTSEAKFQFVEYIITKSIHIHKNINRNKKDYKLSLEPSGILNTKIKQFQLALDLEVIDKDEDSLLNVEIVGFFTYEGEAEEIKNFLLVNAPALLYPYLRAYVSSITTLSGLGTHTLPTMNLLGLKEELEKNIEIFEDTEEDI
jgi:preprotein translocase subunit SecB